MYTSSITRNHRTAFIILIDCSGSMAEVMEMDGKRSSKAQIVADITNDLIFELVERARRDDGVRDYYDIAILGYSGDDDVTSLLPNGQEMISITELAASPRRMRNEIIRQKDPDGEVVLYQLNLPLWVEPHAEGLTPMCEALRRARDMVAQWVAAPANRESFPPVIFNITDGEATDNPHNELCGIAEEIRSIATADGNVLLCNIHIASSASHEHLFFPTVEESGYKNCNAQLLYKCSSEMPELFNKAIRQVKGMEFCPPFRAMSFNASAAELIAMLNIGSISVKTE